MKSDATTAPSAPAPQVVGRTNANVWIILAAVIALGLKLNIALNTEGTNDVYFFHQFGHDMAQHGLEWTYTNRVMFNHPPPVAYFLQGLFQVSQSPSLRDNGVTYPFLLRLPGIIADLAVVLILMRLRERWRLPTWSLILLALTPVSLMVSGFHGNTDPVLVLCVVAAAYFCVKERPILCGVALAAACGIKIIPLLLLPLFFSFWWTRKRAPQFSLSFVAVVAAYSAYPLLNFPVAFAKNVLAYGSYWGIWGITYWLRLTGWSEFSVLGHTRLPATEVLVMNLLKVVIIAGVVAIAWRSRNLDGRGLFRAIACSWLVFFIFAPGTGPQYLVWLMPFLLVLSPVAFASITAASSCFLFFFYNTIAAGLPWNLAISKDNLIEQWAPWTIWPWLGFIAALVFEWRRVTRLDPSLRLFSLQPIEDSDS